MLDVKDREDRDKRDNVFLVCEHDYIIHKLKRDTSISEYPDIFLINNPIEYCNYQGCMVSTGSGEEYLAYRVADNEYLAFRWGYPEPKLVVCFTLAEANKVKAKYLLKEADNLMKNDS